MIGRSAVASCAFACLVACGGGQVLRPPSSAMGDADRMRASAPVSESQSLAPQALAQADAERALAKKAALDGDDTAASLYAERAIAGYNRALVLSRLARATRALDEANEAKAAALETARALSASRATIAREGDDLDKQLKIAREAALPPPAGPADPTREAARLVAARSLVTQARLVCGAARLLSSQVEGLADVETELAALEKRVEGRGTAPIDAAARTRANCLTMLTRARRSTPSGSAQPDALLSELSASGVSDAPSRDERGVVLTLRNAWKGDGLTPEAETKLKELGRVAAAHPGYAVQVVLHDATQPSVAERATNEKRAQAAAKAIAAGGADASKIKVEQAGARAPVVDPTDAEHRARNARVEIVFVAPGA